MCVRGERGPNWQRVCLRAGVRPRRHHVRRVRRRPVRRRERRVRTVPPDDDLRGGVDAVLRLQRGYGAEQRPVGVSPLR